MPAGQMTTGSPRQVEDVQLDDSADQVPDLLHVAGAALYRRGIPYRRLQVIRLRLRSGSPGIPDFHLPLLEVTGDDGVVVAAISFEERSRLYHVSVASAEVEVEPCQVPADRPEDIPALLLGYEIQDDAP
jgi:hypothetical protein